MRSNENKKCRMFGGNGEVTISNGQATKRLKSSANFEKRKRFRIEMDVLREAAASGLPNIVEVIAVNAEEPSPSIVMKAYEGNADALLDRTLGKVTESVRLLIPVVRTLSELARRENPIYHRDLKPDNLLYENTAEGPRLVLADFGCAYFQTDADSRLTQDFRGVGAMAYRAPEYQYGRVDDVTEKGDIFSLGKLLWHFINGVPKEVFPYTLWFPSDYNLKYRFPAESKIDEVNLVIADAVQYAPRKRCSYAELIDRLERLIFSSGEAPNMNLKAKLLAQEKLDELRNAELRALTSSLLGTFHEDLKEALQSLYDSLQTDDLERMIDTPGFPIDQATSSVVDKLSNHPIWNYHGPRLSIETRLYPATDNAPLSSGFTTDLPYLGMGFQIAKRTVLRLYYVKDDKLGLIQVVDGEHVPHEAANLLRAFERVLEEMVSS